MIAVEPKHSKLFGVYMPKAELNAYVAALIIIWLVYSLTWSGVCLVAWTWILANAAIGLSFVGSFGPAFMLAKRSVKRMVLRAAEEEKKGLGV